MHKMFFAFTLFFCITSCGQTTQSNALSNSEQDCGPDATVECSFLNMPNDISSKMKIPFSSGAPMIISGTIYKEDGKTPFPDVYMYAYHTDEKGKYSKSGNETGVQKWHGKHHGWCKSDSLGRYEINTIRPAQYPDNTMPAHIHSTIREPGGKKPYWINDFVFKDDLLVNKKYLASLMPGDSGIVDLTWDGKKWTGVRNITLR
ncbi:MAG: hypothetical protein WKF35_02530 [Ferruginibacter sp.]